MSRKLAVLVVMVLALGSWSRVYGQLELLGRESSPVESNPEMRVYYVFTITEDKIVTVASNRWIWNKIALSTTTDTGKTVTRVYRSANNMNQNYFTIQSDMEKNGATHIVAVKINVAKDLATILQKGWLPEEQKIHVAPIVPGHSEVIKGRNKEVGTKIVVNECPKNITQDNSNVKIAGFCLMSHGNEGSALLDDWRVMTTYDLAMDGQYDNNGDLVPHKDILARLIPGAVIMFCGCNTGGEWSENDMSFANQVAYLFRERNVKVRGRIESGAVHDHYSHGMAYQYFLTEDGQGYRLEKGNGLGQITKGKFGDNEIVVDGQTFQRTPGMKFD